MPLGNSVFIVSDGEVNSLTLRKTLNDAGIRVHEVNSCAEARQILSGLAERDIVFSYTALPDGAWADILALAMEGDLSVPVVVVSRAGDIKLYTTAIEKGCADFKVPPFYQQEVTHVLNCATWKEAAV
jgi:DNA-binding NtrC family response regulator